MVKMLDKSPCHDFAPSRLTRPVGYGTPPTVAGQTRRLKPALHGALAPLLAALAWIAGGAVSAQEPAPSVPRTRVTVEGGASAAPVMTPGHPAPPPTGPPLAAGLLAWGAEGKATKVTLGAAQASFAFVVSNISSEPVTVTSVVTSCGCTVAKLAPMPWTLAPGSHGTIDVVMNLAGKRGVNIKNVTVNTDHGYKTLTVTTNILEPAPDTMGRADRLKNLQIASANRQAVLHGECAACHATPALYQRGAQLYQAACTICHEAGNRAASVPDLKHLPKAADAEYWRAWITTSAQGKLMPAFAIEHGGILTAAQIDSLVQYLTATMGSGKPVSPIR